MRAVCKTIPLTTVKSRLRCKRCGMGFSSLTKRLQHVRSMHRQEIIYNKWKDAVKQHKNINKRFYPNLKKQKPIR
jgi:hypothetical protein